MASIVLLVCAGLFLLSLAIEKDSHSGSSSQGANASLHPSTNAATMSVRELVKHVNSKDGAERLVASQELLRRGKGVVADLKSAGVRPMATLSPPRADVIYSLLVGLPPGDYRRDSFGISAEAGTGREELVAMGQRHGFTLSSNRLNLSGTPTCYVQLEPGKDLLAVMKAVIMSEPRVVTVNLNYRET